MRHPKQSGLANLKLVEATIGYIGQYEPDDRKAIDALPKGSAGRAARLIGRGCMVKITSKHPTTQAAGDRLIQRAITETANARIQIEQERPARLMSRMASLLLAAPHEIAQARRQMHGEVISQIKELDVQLRGLGVNRARGSTGKADSLRGEKTGLLGLGLITRQGHPATLGLPALTHHDNDPHMTRGKSYDLFVTNINPDGTPEHQKVQVKQRCLGLCTDTPELRRRRWEEQDRYEPDIALVSGHCDIVIRPTGNEDPNLRTTTNLLLAEASNRLHVEQIAEMDDHTGSLVLSMTMNDSRRMGTAFAGPAVVPMAA
jgi:hypothetical protein